MDHFEMVDKLRQRANVTYEEAKNALEACDWDILDALVLLENEGKIKRGEQEQPQSDYSTKSAQDEAKDSAKADPDAKRVVKRIWDGVYRLVKKGNENTFTISRKQEEILSVPVTVLVLLLIFVQPFSIIALIAGLFLGCRYSFSGPNIGKKINDVMDHVADAAQNDQE